MKNQSRILAIILVAAIMGGFLHSCGSDGPEPAVNSLTAVNPANGATGIPVTQAITVTFSKDIDQTTVIPANITLTRANGTANVEGAIIYDATSRTVTFTPTLPMQAGALYTFTVTTSVMTKAAASNFVSTFTTQQAPFLYITSTDPSSAPINIWSMNPDGSSQTQLTAYTDEATGTASGVAAWSPDFSRIAFIVTAGTSPNEISDLYVMNADGTGITNLTDGAPNYEVMSLKWASDGSRIFFLFRAGGSDVFDIGSIGPDKTGFANLTNVASMGADVSVVPPGLEISRDGTKLAYAAGNLGDLTILPIDIYVMNIDGTSNTKITAAAPGSVAWYPTFSPDGKKICYGSGAGAAGIGLSAVNVDGSGQQTIVPEEAGRIIIPWAYSPDGTQLITMFLFDVGGDTVPDVYLVSADGATLTRLTNSSGTNQGWAGPWAWSPDGTKVAYIYDDMDNGPVNLYVANRDGSGVRDITGFTGGTLVFAHPLFMELGLNVAQWFDDGTQMAFTQMVNTGTPTVTSANVALAKTDGSAVTPLTNMTAPQIAVFVAWR